MKNNHLVIEQINGSNLNRYRSGDVVEQYQKEPYHADRVQIAIRLLSKEIDNHFKTIPKEKINILDLGSGNGEVSRMIANKGYSVFAADYSSDSFLSLHSAKNERIALLSFDANSTFPLSDETFEAIYCGELIEHVFDTRRFLLECNRILKTNGILVLTTPNLASLQDRIKFVFGIPPRQINPLHEYLWLHIRQFSARSIKSVLTSVGFSDVQIKSNYVKFYFRKEKKIQSKLLARIFPSWGGSLICSTIKTKNEAF